MIDVVVVGGGPAGLAAAIFAASSGLSVTLFERRWLPADKACGEGIMPGGVELLEKMRVCVQRSRPFDGIRYFDGEHVAEARFRGGRGLGVRRSELSRALLARARQVGVDVRDRTPVVGATDASDGVVIETAGEAVRAQWLVAADGLSSPLRRTFGLASANKQPRMARYGFRRHFRVEPWSSFVEVHWSDGAEAYVTPVAENEIGIAVLWHGHPPERDAWLDPFPRLASVLQDAEPVSRLRGAGPLRQYANRVTRGRLALVGDAAGYVDALTGEGVALGLRSADALVASLRRGSLHAYEKEYWRLSRRYRLMTELILSMATRPRLRRVAVRRLSRCPAVFERLLNVLT
ncbi:MAG TPA: FAD-dependent oxidoreductase [Vicinamibacteria bacterium]|nr:FAD-dependent oxidoreductase [Vicinamibacteria bacterium]